MSLNDNNLLSILNNILKEKKNKRYCKRIKYFNWDNKKMDRIK